MEFVGSAPLVYKTIRESSFFLKVTLIPQEVAAHHILVGEAVSGDKLQG